MSNHDVRRHYENPDPIETLLAGVESFLAAQEPPLTAEKLAPLDQFHVGGINASRELASLASLRPGVVVLDAGSGLGGPSRYLAEAFDCRVAGIDFTPGFVAIAQRLAERTGFSDRVSYAVGDVLALRSEDSSYDCVWTQHVVMNIRDRTRLYREFRRVLKPGGQLVAYDVIAADEKPELYFPTPWASSKETSFLLTRAETEQALDVAGFKIETWKDVTAAAVSWAQQARTASGSPLGFVMGSGFAEMTANLVRNIGEGRVRLVMTVCA